MRFAVKQLHLGCFTPTYNYGEMISAPLNPAHVEQKASLRFVAVALAVVFAATHGWVLLSWNALYWDDWSILTSNTAELHRMFKFVGFEMAGIVHAWFVPLGAGVYKVVLLISLALMSACVFLIARSYGLKYEQAGWITALFIVAPLNTSKIAAVNVAAVLLAAVFFLAWLLLIRDLNKPSLLQRIVVLGLFSVAFYLPSSLAFFAMPAMSIAWHAYRSRRDWRQRLAVFFRRADFLLLPFVQFFIFRLFFFKPHASIANEYQRFGIRSSRLQEAVDRLQTDFLVDMPWAVRIVVIALPLLLVLRVAKRPQAQHTRAIGCADAWMFLGLSSCFFALLPYLAVGRLPVFSDWNSRYHLFLPLGFALVCWGMSRYIAIYTQRTWLGIGTYGLIFALSAGFSVRSYVEYADDWRKQVQLMTALQDQKFIQTADNIVIADFVVYAKRRELRYYEYTQMMKRVQPGWHGLAVSNAQLQNGGGGSLKRYLDSLGGIENIQADPEMFGLPGNWQWNDSCVVLVAYELDDRVQIRQMRDEAAAHESCVLPASITHP